jgi:hypothetical protein
MPGSSGIYVRGISGNKIVGYYADSSYRYHGFVYTISVLRLSINHSSGIINVSFDGAAGTIYNIEASTDLVHWSTIATNTLDSSGKSTYSESMPGPMRYYKASD